MEVTSAAIWSTSAGICGAIYAGRIWLRNTLPLFYSHIRYSWHGGLRFNLISFWMWNGNKLYWKVWLDMPVKILILNQEVGQVQQQCILITCKQKQSASSVWQQTSICSHSLTHSRNLSNVLILVMLGFLSFGAVTADWFWNLDIWSIGRPCFLRIYTVHENADHQVWWESYLKTDNTCFRLFEISLISAI